MIRSWQKVNWRDRYPDLVPHCQQLGTGQTWEVYSEEKTVFPWGTWVHFWAEVPFPEKEDQVNPITQVLEGSRNPPNKQIGFSNLGIKSVSQRSGSETHSRSDQCRDKESFRDKDHYGESRPNRGRRWGTMRGRELCPPAERRPAQTRQRERSGRSSVWGAPRV